MLYRKVGNSGLKVSEISLGSWLTYGGYVPKDQAIKTIRKAYHLGVNSFDTANIYEKGEAERIMGEALSAFPRPSYVLSTKVYWNMRDDPNGGGLSRKHIIEECEASLQRLGVDYIDIYYCHRFDCNTPLEETLRAMEDLIRQGKILYVGVSAWKASQIVQAIKIADKYLLNRVIVNQPKYNILHRDIEKEILPVCEAFGIGQIVYSPLAQGLLTGKYQNNKSAITNRPALEKYINERNKNIISELQNLAHEENISLIQLVLAWVLRNKNIASAIVGASKPEQIEQNVLASGITLSQKTIDKIECLLENN